MIKKQQNFSQFWAYFRLSALALRDFLEAPLGFCPMFWLVMFTTRLNSANFRLDSSSDEWRDIWVTWYSVYIMRFRGFPIMTDISSIMALITSPVQGKIFWWMEWNDIMDFQQFYLYFSQFYLFYILCFSPHPEGAAWARHVIEAPPEPLAHDGVQDGVEDGVEVVEDTGDHEQHVLSLRPRSHYIHSLTYLL